MRKMMRTIGLVLACACISLMAVPSASAASKFVAVIGDSITGGVPQGTASQSWTSLISAERDLVIRNLSSPGASLGATNQTGFYNATTINMLTQLAGFWGALDVVIIQAGTNDFGTNQNWGDTYNSAKAILNWARTNNKKVIVMDPIWRYNENVPNTQGNLLNTYRFFLATVCGEFPERCTFLHREDTILGTAAGAAYYDANEVATGTQLHPNVQGQRFLADWVKAGAAAAGVF